MLMGGARGVCVWFYLFLCSAVGYEILVVVHWVGQGSGLCWCMWEWPI